MQLYRLLPGIIREKDRLGSGVTDEASEETVLQKILYAIEQEGDVTQELISGLRGLLDPDSCPVGYLPLLEYLLGSRWPASWPENRRRLAIASVVELYHHSGQRLSWVAVLSLLGNIGFFPWELWKEEIYETTHYSRYGGGEDGYYGGYHAARVDITDGNADLSLTDSEWALIETFRPIHVLLRRRGIEIALGPDAPKKFIPLPGSLVIKPGGFSLDCSGLYIENGTYLGQKAYSQVNGSFWLWWFDIGGQGYWLLSQILGEFIYGCFFTDLQSTPGDPIQIYAPFAPFTGNPVVELPDDNETDCAAKLGLSETIAEADDVVDMVIVCVATCETNCEAICESACETSGET
jgi:phage tail P2-like protein